MITSIPVLIARVSDDNDYLKLKEMANVHDDWDLEYDKNGIKIWSKILPDAIIKTIKVWSVFSKISSADLYNTLMDPFYRKKWDTCMIMSYDIGYLNPNNTISYYAVSFPPLKRRDFVLQTSWLDRGSEHYIINHSVCHKDHPPREGFIRAVSYFTGYFIKCAPDDGSEFYFISQTDPQGIIPSWFVNKCMQIFAPRFIKILEKAAYAYNDWKIQNNPGYFPWMHPEQMKCPRIAIEDCVPSEEEKASTFFQYMVKRNININSAHSLQNLESTNMVLHPNVTTVTMPGPSIPYKRSQEISPSVKAQKTFNDFQETANINKKGRNKNNESRSTTDFIMKKGIYKQKRAERTPCL